MSILDNAKTALAAPFVPWLLAYAAATTGLAITSSVGWWNAGESCDNRVALFEKTNTDNGREIARLQESLAKDRTAKLQAEADLKTVQGERDKALKNLASRANTREAKVKKAYADDPTCRDWGNRPVCPGVDGL